MLDKVVAPVTPKVLDKVVAPVTPKVLERVVAPVTPKVPVKDELPPISKSVPTNNFLAIAAPPAMVKQPPAVELVASVTLLKLITPVTPKVLEREVAPVTPKVLERVVAPVTPKVLERVEAPVTLSDDCKIVAPDTFNILDIFIKEPVVANVKSPPPDSKKSV